MLSPSAAAASAPFIEWLERMDREGRVFLSVVTIHEIKKGIALLEHKGATAKAGSLTAWLAGLISAYEDKIIGLDPSGASLSGKAEARAIAAGRNPGMADAVVAGLAKARDLTVVTRNTKDFLMLGGAALSPDEAARSAS